MTIGNYPRNEFENDGSKGILPIRLVGNLRTHELDFAGLRCPERYAASVYVRIKNRQLRP